MSIASSFTDTLASMSQDIDVEIVDPRYRNKHLTLAQMRGIIPLFNHYFNLKDQFGNKKKISRQEKQSRWISYKNKIWRDYRRAIKGTFASEQALIRRYSEPLTFLKYKLKRANNLKVSDLCVEDQQYYKEIGGLENVEALISRQRNNLDSIERIMPRNSKKRRVADVYALDYERNHNVQVPQYIPPTVEIVNKTSASNAVKNESQNQKMDEALDKLNENLDVFEHEQMLKRKIEAYETTQEKVKALMDFVKNIIHQKPEMIGSIPGMGGLEDQLVISFDIWLHANKTVILQRVSDSQLFIKQIVTMRSDPKDFVTFLQNWKLIRIFKNDEFDAVWKYMQKELNISVKSDKEEADDQDFDLVQL